MHGLEASRDGRDSQAVVTPREVEYSWVERLVGTIPRLEVSRSSFLHRQHRVDREVVDEERPSKIGENHELIDPCLACTRDWLVIHCLHPFVEVLR